MLPLFTSLRSLTLVDVTTHFHHWGVIPCLKYLYKVAAVRSTLQEVHVLDAIDVGWTRFLLDPDAPLRLPAQMERDQRALRVGIARLNDDLKNPDIQRYNAYRENWFEHSFLKRFLTILGGEASFPAVWAQPGGTVPRPGNTPDGVFAGVRSAWGQWVEAAWRRERMAGAPGLGGGIRDPQRFWPPSLGQRYAAAEAAANAPVDTDTYEVLQPLTVQDNIARRFPFHNLDCAKRPTARQRSGRWPTTDALHEASPATRWLSMCRLGANETTLGPYAIIDNGTPGGVMSNTAILCDGQMLGQELWQFQPDGGPNDTDYRIDRLFFL